MRDSRESSEERKKSGSDIDESGMGAEGQWLHYDEHDSLPSSLTFNNFDVSCIVFSIFTYILDLFMDIYVAYIYYLTENILYFVLTLVFVIIPACTMSAFSLRWYVMDMENQNIPKTSCTKWILRTVFLLLQLAPVLRYVDSLLYGLKSRKAEKEGDRPKQIKYYTYMVNEDADSTLLRLFEGFMESAPQVTLQLYILIFHFNDPTGPFYDKNVYLQILAIFSSLVSLAWSLSSYHRSLRYSQPDKPNISYKGTILQFFWHLFTISARVFALGVFAATQPVLVVPFCIAHWLAMLSWLIIQGGHACSNQCQEAMFNLVVAFVYIFTFFNVREEPTRWKYVAYYIICFIENTILLFAWYFSLNVYTSEIYWFRVTGLVGDYASFGIGILCMIIYYGFFHPSRTCKNEIEALNKEFQVDGNQQPRNRQEFLTRKGSIDQSTIAHISGNSQRRNVTFALDQQSTQESQKANQNDETKL